ncbi:hypothetical protein M3181_06860 [Mesobacillus maritimus]|uniref:hypothetical protein n=1 Tax=Mesobacillus maritimus TaxID=1643336 RepID=UPI00203F0BA8|nr:hypothetical protein [Mesobacillus maritimus]MCM3668719.1 hypothetical protein [Mesobacillus maritimus]
MKKRTALLTLAGALLVAGNVYLTLHTESKVERTSFVMNWFTASTETLTKTLQTEGVVIPAEEHPIYFHQEEGGFEQFLVQQGEEVTAGTTLFEYKSLQVDADRQRLTTEIEQLNREVALIEDQIQQLEYLQTVSASSADRDSVPVSGDGLSSFPTGVNSGTIVEVTIEKEIYDKEREIRRLEDEIDVHESSLASLDVDSQVAVPSNVDGTVKQIQYDLKNPIMTIISDHPKVRGAFTEEDLLNVKEGMEAYVSSDLVPDVVGGKLTKIAGHSENEPDVKKESEFPFEVELELTEEEEEEESQEGLADDVRAEDESAAGSAGGVEGEGTGAGSNLKPAGGTVDIKYEVESVGGTAEDETEAGSAGGNGNIAKKVESASGTANQENEAESADGIDTNPEPDELLEDPEVPVNTEVAAADTENDSSPGLVHGSHVDITIVLDEAIGAVTVADKQIEKGSYLYVLTRTGKIERRQVKMGLAVGGRVEVKEGLEPGETVLENPNQVARVDEPFITRLDFLRLDLKLLKEEPVMDWVKLLWVGFSKR